MVDHGRELAHDALRVLVREHADDGGDAVEREVDGQRGRERRGDRGVVRGVDQDGRLGAHDLQPAGARRRGEALREHVVVDGVVAAAEERLDRGDRDGGVLRLVRAEHREEHVAVRAREALHADDLATDREGRVEEAEPLALDRPGGLRELGGAHELGHDVGGLRAGHAVRCGLDDAGLGARDLRHGGSQALRVIEGDGREDRDLAVADVGAVTLAAPADLDHGHVDGRVGERREREHRQRLEEGDGLLARGDELPVDQVDEGLDVCPVAAEGLVGDGQAVDHDALV